ACAGLREQSLRGLRARNDSTAARSVSLEEYPMVGGTALDRKPRSCRPLAIAAATMFLTLETWGRSNPRGERPNRVIVAGPFERKARFLGVLVTRINKQESASPRQGGTLRARGEMKRGVQRWCGNAARWPESLLLRRQGFC